MDRKIFLESVIEQVREIPISSVVGTRVSLVRRGGYDKGLCPFHNDRHIGSFVVSDRKNVFKCFSCGVGGDNIKFYSETEGVNYVEGAMRLALRYGFISVTDYEDFSSKKFSEKKSKELERIYIEKDRDKFKNEIAPVEILDKVYSSFAVEAGLSPEHKKYLIEERGISEEDIIEGKYFTFPSRREKFITSYLSRLESEHGYNSDILKNVPGFYRERSTGEWKFTYIKGIGIPITSADKLIHGVQVRRDKAEENKSRYIWFSSSFIENDEKLSEKYEYGTGAGAPIDVIYPKTLKYSCIMITEGRFKAKVLSDTYNTVAISVQGICSWINIVEQVKLIRKIYPQHKFNNIYLAYDADMAYNVQVFNQAVKMTNKLVEELGDVKIHYNMWDTVFGKGIDDVILSGNIDKIDIMDKVNFDKLYRMFMDTVKEAEDEKIENVEKGVLKSHFDSLVLPHFKKYSV